MKNDRYDFGEDDDIVPVSDPAFDAWVEKAAPALNAPNATPRFEMWDAIHAAQKTARDAEAGRVSGVIPLRGSHWRLMSVIAAALLLGVAIDRVALRRVATPRAPVATVSPAPADSGDPSRLYRMAAAQTLTQAEALLTAYRASSASDPDRAASRQLGTWGRDILSSTRLLMDSPAGEDPRLRALLDDLELVLVQIIELSGAPRDATDRAQIDRARERALIDGTLEDRDLLPRLRTAVPAGIAGPASD